MTRDGETASPRRATSHRRPRRPPVRPPIARLSARAARPVPRHAARPRRRRRAGRSRRVPHVLRSPRTLGRARRDGGRRLSRRRARRGHRRHRDDARPGRQPRRLHRLRPPGRDRPLSGLVCRRTVRREPHHPHGHARAGRRHALGSGLATRPRGPGPPDGGQRQPHALRPGRAALLPRPRHAPARVAARIHAHPPRPPGRLVVRRPERADRGRDDRKPR